VGYRDITRSYCLQNACKKDADTHSPPLGLENTLRAPECDFREMRPLAADAQIYQRFTATLCPHKNPTSSMH